MTGYCTGYYVNNFTGDQTIIIAKSIDGGISWQVVKEQSYGLFTDIQFFNENTGYVNGKPPLLTTNGGATWKSIMDSTGYYILSMFFLNISKGWFGSSNYPVYTIDGGGSWETQSLPAQSNVHGIDFIDENTGWCVGMNNISIPRIFKTTTSGLTFINGDSSIAPADYYLEQNYPNPFNPSTKINYELPVSGFVTLKIYDALGIEIATLVNQKQNAGSYDIDFNASKLSSGVYFYKLTSGEFTETRSMLLVK
jgi:photosystem II stability/assembly factor-like uncharacterized protein